MKKENTNHKILELIREMNKTSLIKKELVASEELEYENFLEFSLQGSLYTGDKAITLDELLDAFIDMCESKGWEFCGITSPLVNKID